MRCRTSLLLLLILTVCLVPARLTAQGTPPPRFAFLDLGTLGGESAEARAVSEMGHIAGSAEDAEGRRRAFLWTRAGMRDLGSFGTGRSEAFGVNDLGEVVGHAAVPADVPVFGRWLMPFRWRAGTMLPLDLFRDDHGTAYAINNAGHAAGTSADANQATVAARWHATFTERPGLDVLRGPDASVLVHNAVGFAINARGDVAGVSTTRHGTVATIWRDGVPYTLGVPENGGSSARALNDAGDVAGVWENGQAFLWADGVIRFLGEGTALGINARRWVVGTHQERAWLWTPEHGRMDLNALTGGLEGVRLTVAADVNDAGTIVGTARRNGRLRAFRLGLVNGR